MNATDTSPGTSHHRRVWFVTGAGRGLGRAFVDAALAAGDRVVATTRSASPLDDLAAARPVDLRVLRLDVRDGARVQAVVAAAVAEFGRLDVVVNNAGFGHVGAVEELTDAEVSGILEVNFLAALRVTRAVLPQLREQGSGHVVQVSTVGAVGSMPFFGAYNASKWALEGFSEALSKEVAGFGIRVTIAEFGGFATDWGGSSLRFSTPDAAYDELRAQTFGTPEVPWPAAEAAAEAATEADDGTDGASDADPTVAARALLAHVDAPEGPLRLLVGQDAPVHVAAALDLRREDYTRDPRFSWPG